jgi:Ras-related protein Rab-23
MNGEDVLLMIWDTAGQEEFGKLTRAYYQGAHACVVAFSTTDRDSFDEVESWIEKVEEVVQDIPMVLVQNKVDLIKNVRCGNLLSDSHGSSICVNVMHVRVHSRTSSPH